jgi:EamA domain-containing membrane protein RarD
MKKGEQMKNSKSLSLSIWGLVALIFVGFIVFYLQSMQSDSLGAIVSQNVMAEKGGKLILLTFIAPICGIVALATSKNSSNRTVSTALGIIDVIGGIIVFGMCVEI